MDKSILQPESLPYRPQSLSILVADEYVQTRSLVVRTLKKMNFVSIFEASSGDTALQIIRDNPVDLVITELNLKGLDGFEIIEDIRRRNINSDIPIIIVTGESTKEVIVKAIDVGANDFLLKPFPIEDLENKVKNMLIKYFSPDETTQNVRNIEKFVLFEAYDEALQLVNRALPHSVDNPRLNYLKAVILSKQEQYQEATDILKRNIEINPGFYKNYVLLSDIQMKTQNVEGGIESIKKELEYNAKQPARQTQLAYLLIQQGDLEGAKEHFREALKENVKYIKALEGMVIVFMMGNNVDKVMYYLKRWRKADIESIRPLEKLIDYCMARNNLKDAEFFLKDEKKRFPKDGNIYMALANLYLKEENPSMALSTIDEALREEPDNLSFQICKINILITSKEIQSALSVYESVVKRLIDSDIYFKLAELLEKNGIFAESLELLYRLSAMRYSTLKIYPLINSCLSQNKEYFKRYYIQEQISKLMLVDNTFRKEMFDNKALIKERRKTSKVKDLKVS